jgi:hypothetical protein
MIIAQITEAVNAIQSFDSVKSPWGIIVGFFIVVSICCGLGAWRVCAVIYKDFAIPARDRMVKHLDQVDASMRSLEQSIGSIPHLESKIDVLTDKVSKVSDRVEHIERNVISSGNRIT